MQFEDWTLKASIKQINAPSSMQQQEQRHGPHFVLIAIHRKKDA
jgi:hypothetical protein